jgi:hypothetical protein
MVRQYGVLSNDTLRAFFAAWAEVVTVVRRVKESSDAGNLIQYPKIPQAVSESIAAKILIKEKKILQRNRRYSWQRIRFIGQIRRKDSSY